MNLIHYFIIEGFQSDEKAMFDYETAMAMPLPWEKADQVSSGEDDLNLFKQQLGISG